MRGGVSEVNSARDLLWFLTLTYTVILIIANWFDARLIEICKISTDAGTLVFPFTFLLSDLITEVYGFKHARRAVWCGFLFNALFIFYSQIVIHLPSPTYETNNHEFDTILRVNARVIFASAVSYLFSESFNSYAIAKLKIKMQGRFLIGRFAVSNIIAAGIDSFIFTMIAFYSDLKEDELYEFILSMWLVKVLIEIVVLPISVKLARKLKRIEQLDVYDRKTDFNMFHFDTHYSEFDNNFRKKKVS